jgi:hypothetical protein
MGFQEIFPDLTVRDVGSRTLTGGASPLVILNDASDASYVTAAGTSVQNWSYWARFTAPTVPAGAVIESIQMKVRYSHWKKVTGRNEIIQPISILTGRLVGTKHLYDVYTIGERVPSYSVGLTAIDWIGPHRKTGYDGKTYLGEWLRPTVGSSAPGAPRRIYASLGVVRQGTPWNLARVYSFSLIVHWNEKPTINLLNPSGTEVVALPQFEWEYNDPENNPQDRVELRVYREATTLLSGFDVNNPTTFPPVYRRPVSGTSVTHKVEELFGNDGESFVAYIRGRHYLPLGSRLAAIWQNDELSPYADWDSSAFTLDIAEPLIPEITTVYDSIIHGVKVSVRGQDNVLGFNASSGEMTDTEGMAAGANTTLANVSSQFLHGSRSFSLTRTTSTGDATATSTEELMVKPNERYTGVASFRANTTGRVCGVVLIWLDANGTLVGASSGADQHTMTDVTTGWVLSTVSAVAHANAAFATLQVIVTGAAVGEVHFVDQLGLFPDRRTTLLTENQASLETDTTGWAGGVNTSIARNTEQFKSGYASLSLTRITSTGDATAVTPISGGTGFRVKATTAYIASVWFRAKTTTRSCRVSIGWYDSASVFISSTDGTLVTDSLTGFVQATASGTSPAGAAFARLTLTVQAAVVNEVHYADTIGIWPGSTVGSYHAWSVGGFVHHEAEDHLMELDRSLDTGVTWRRIPEQRGNHEPGHQLFEHNDYAVPSQATVTYRARIVAMNHDGDMLGSPLANPVSVTMQAFTNWWLRNIQTAAEDSIVVKVSKLGGSLLNPQTVDHALDDDAAVVSGEGFRGSRLAVGIWVLSPEDWDMFLHILTSGDVLLLQDVIGRQWFVRPGDTVDYEMLRAVTLAPHTTPVRHAHHVELEFIEVDEPAALVGSHHA